MPTRWRIGLALAAVVVATVAGAAPASAAITWEGTWSSTFGEIKMDAGGSGTYPNCGTISGGLSDGGMTNKGTWTECSSNGKYEFHMGASGGSFTGSYTRGESDTCVSPPCNWDGTCIAGPCTQNSDTPACPSGARTAQSSPTGPTATVSDITRKVEVSLHSGAWEPLRPDMKLREGDKIHTGFKASVTLTFPDGSTLHVKPMSLILVDKLDNDSTGKLRVRVWLRLGEMSANVNRLPGCRSDFDVKTPTTTASIRGTIFSTLYTGFSTIYAVTKGSVAVTAKKGGTVVVPAGMQTESTAKKAATPVKIGKGETRGGLTVAQALKRVTAKLATELKACKFGVVSTRFSPARRGWNAALVIVSRRQGIDDKPKGTAKFLARGKKVAARNALAKKIARGCS